MEAILDFTHNAMSKIISGYTIMSGIHENPMVDTKIMHLFFHIENYIDLILDFGQNGGHFGFLRFTSTLLKIQEGS